ncbi:hypothetical protein PV328_010101 [Microctonus aethiopoides]|uniref:Vitellogenin domain-containing protein n=1 Tax=Microctonus aethiopoides TaxID=144406 RepID=A0AA39C7D5_9HYME|nr:hypothetical protein PV328_010101 [Microctonus aethiopoides]
MARGIELAAVLLACLAIATGIPTQFPHGKTLVYNYYGDVKAGIIEPAPYASQFAIAGQLHIKHDTSDPKLSHAYYAVLTNVKTGMHNGIAAHFQRTAITNPIPDAAKVIEEPFLIVNNDKGELQGVKIREDEPGWSKNMKMAIATMLQLDMTSMKLELPVKHHNFIAKENTIQGECWTSYDVHGKLPMTEEYKKNFIVTKFGSPKNCSNYNVHLFDHTESEQCSLPREAPVNMASRRVFDIEHQGDNILIKSLIAHGGTNYFPLKGRSEAHYVLNNASFVLENVVSSSEVSLPEVDFKNIPMINDFSYKRPEKNYALNSAVDVTHGRHVVHQDKLITLIKKMLIEAAEYLEEHHLEAKEPDFKHGQTINRLLYNMGYMTTESLEQVLTDITVDHPTHRDNVMKDIYVGLISQTGTHASAILVRDLIMSHRVNAYDASLMLGNLPMNIRSPTMELLDEMEKMTKPNAKILESTHERTILCFATMIYRTFKNENNPGTNATLQNYLKNFYEQLIKDDQTYKMRVVYLNAIRNIQVGNIVELLTPIIRGDVQVPENSIHLRLMAIWSIEKAVANNYNLAHDLLWPIMADYNVPLKLRIAAYDILIRQAPTMTNILHIYWFMVYEKNEHLYNYHHTTIKGLANSVDPCDYQLRELTTKIMRFTKIHEPVSYALSSSYIADSMDDIYGHGEKVRYSTTLSEVTGLPEVIHIELITIQGRKPVSEFAIDLHLEGFDDIFRTFMEKRSIVMGKLNDEKVLNILKQAASDMPTMKKMHVDLIIMRKGRVVSANHFDEKSLHILYQTVGQLFETMATEAKIMKQHVIYTNLYEQQIISEMGLPVVIGTRLPQVASLNFNFTSDRMLSSPRLNVDLKLWRHGDYYMSIYNPLMDVWHSIKRSTAIDVSLPIRLIGNLNNGVMKLTLPLLPAEKQETTVGMKIHTKDITTVTEDETNTLKSACPTCQYHEIVTKGVAVRKYHVDTFDSRDVGLEFSSSIFDCENDIDNAYLKKEFLRSVVYDHKNSWNDIFVHGVLGVRQFIRNIVLSPPMGSCGILTKFEPSTIYPTSHVDFIQRNYIEGKIIDEGEIRSAVKRMKVNMRGSIEAFAATTNESSRLWDVNVDLDFSEGHLNDNGKIQLTRVTPGEKTLKICFDGQKSYPAVPADLFKVDTTKEETTSKLIISMAYTDDRKVENVTSCPRDETFVSITIKGELTDEQKKSFARDTVEGLCKKDIDNPLMKHPSDIIPKTINCIDETIRHTTLRKYTAYITHKKVPHSIISRFLEFNDMFDGRIMSRIKYTNERMEPENIKVGIEFPLDKKVMNTRIVTPFLSYDMLDNSLDVDVYPPRLNGFGPDYEKYLWMPFLDNTRFNMKFLMDYTDNKMKVCTLFPKIAQTLDNGEIPYVVPTEWTLALGNYFNQNFAIFIKNVNNKMAMKVFADDRIVEIIPVNGGFQITIDGEMKNDITGEIYVPSIAKSNYIVKVTKRDNEVITQLNKQSLMIVQNTNSVTLFVNSELQGVIAGLCGHMTGDYKVKISKEYRLK